MDKETKKLFKKLMKTTPYIMEIESAKLVSDKWAPSSGTMKLCSSCFSTIEKTWDHASWCELYKPEDLNAWLASGNS